jgi:hypothetical protein
VPVARPPTTADCGGDAALAAEAEADDMIRYLTLRLASAQEKLSDSQAPALAVEAAAASAVSSAAAAALTATSERSLANAASDAAARTSAQPRCSPDPHAGTDRYRLAAPFSFRL